MKHNRRSTEDIKNGRDEEKLERRKEEIRGKNYGSADWRQIRKPQMLRKNGDTSCACLCKNMLNSVVLCPSIKHTFLRLRLALSTFILFFLCMCPGLCTLHLIDWFIKPYLAPSPASGPRHTFLLQSPSEIFPRSYKYKLTGKKKYTVHLEHKKITINASKYTKH